MGSHSRLFAVLLVAVASLGGAAARVLRICTHISPGFNELTSAAKTKYAAQLDPATKLPLNSVGERGLTVLESDMQGYMHDQREMIFKGQTTPPPGLWSKDSYTLHLYPSYKHTVYYTRAGWCHVGWAPMTVKAGRETCDAAKCKAVPAEDATVSLAPELSGPNNGVLPLGAVTVSDPDTNCCVDFPFSTCNTGMSIAYRPFIKKKWFLRKAVLNILLQLVTFILVFAHAVWFFERHENDGEFPFRYLAGIDDAIWFSAVTVTTVGYGDKAPQSAGGRWVTFGCMFAGILISSIFTAVITTEMETSRAAGDIRSMADFAGKSMCTTAGYWKSDRLLKQHSNKQLFAREEKGGSLEACMVMLYSGKVEAVYYDMPQMQRHMLVSGQAGTFNVVGELSPLRLTPVFQDAAPRPELRLTQPSRPEFPSLKTEYSLMTIDMDASGKLDALFAQHFSLAADGGSSSDEELQTGFLWFLLVYGTLYFLMWTTAIMAKRGKRENPVHPVEWFWAQARIYFNCEGFFGWDQHEAEDETEGGAEGESGTKTLQAVAATQPVARGRVEAALGSSSSSSAGRNDSSLVRRSSRRRPSGLQDDEHTHVVGGIAHNMDDGPTASHTNQVREDIASLSDRLDSLANSVLALTKIVSSQAEGSKPAQAQAPTAEVGGAAVADSSHKAEKTVV